MSLYLHKSNRTERLADALAEIVAQPGPAPLSPEWIAVSSPGMERWLSMQLAERLGVWANPAFPFPRKVIETILDAAAPRMHTHALSYEPTCMLFGLARLLGEEASAARWQQARRYCEHDEHARRRLALAERLADLFDQYLTYRPELVLRWASGAEAERAHDFQAQLMRALIERHGPEHLAERARRALHGLRDPQALAALPARLSVFGVSSLPPLYVELLQALAAQRDVHLFVLQPSREYFADLRAPRGQLSLPDEGFRAETHALLGSFGRVGREFQELLEARTQYREQPRDLFEDPGTDSLLHALQSDLLSLHKRGPDELPRVPLSAADDSLSIHACHGPMREVEVLHDRILQLMAERGVQAHEILVMTPEISAYAPLIDAVFSQPESERPVLPFRIADRGVAESEPLLAAFDSVLDLLASRFGSNQVLDLLGIDLIRERFAIAPEQIDTLRGWVAESGIRFAVDAEHRAQLQQPALAQNTWRFGLARLALGYCTAADAEQLFAEISPAATASEEGVLLGQFFEFCETLFELRALCSTPASASEWRARMELVLARVFEPEPSAPEHKSLLRALLALEEHAAQAGFDERFELASLRALLAREIGTRAPAHGFLSGGVTFCQLMPMRSIPFRVLCLLGLSDGAFPALDPVFALDLIQSDRKLGDRSRRDDDRQLFLEALLCARETLLITYVGQSQKDGKPLPPSGLVSELIEYLAESFSLPGEAPDTGLAERIARMEQRLVLRHPLSAASPRYYDASDPRLFSFSRAGCRAARASQRQGEAPAPFSILRSAPVDVPSELGLHELERALLRPSREFCQRRLGLYLGDDLLALEEREPFELDALDRWQIGQAWLSGQSDPQRALAALRARGCLPLGAAGELVHDQLQAEFAQLAQAFAARTQAERLPALELDLRLHGFHLRGSLSELWATGQVSAQWSKLGRYHELRQFIRHVALCCMAAQEPRRALPEHSVLIGRAAKGGVGEVRFGPLPEPEALLGELLALYREALLRPVPLFTEASRAYASALHKGKSPREALQEARARFGPPVRAEDRTDIQDAYVQQLYADFDAVLGAAESFERLALRLYRPFFAHQEGS